MKSAIVLLLLATSAGFGQATVNYERLAPHCGTLSAFEQISTGCAWPKIQVTASTTNGKVFGFLIVLTYREANGRQTTTSEFVTSRTTAGTFVAQFIDPGDIISIRVSGMEMISGDLSYAP